MILPAPIVSLSNDRIITVTRSRAWGFSLLTGELQDYLFDARWKRYQVCGVVGEFVGYREVEGL